MTRAGGWAAYTYRCQACGRRGEWREDTQNQTPEQLLQAALIARWLGTDAPVYAMARELMQTELQELKSQLLRIHNQVLCEVGSPETEMEPPELVAWALTKLREGVHGPEAG